MPHILFSHTVEAFDCPLREWIADERTRREIQRRFRLFLLSYYPNIEEVARWRAKYDRQDGKPMPPMPKHFKIQPPVYLAKIRYTLSCIISYYFT